MNQYIFILGNHPKLSAAEILSVFPDAKVQEQTSYYLLVSHAALDCKKALAKLGGTIKIAHVIHTEIYDDIIKGADNKKIIFGISEYANKARNQQNKKARNLGMETKRRLQEAGHKVRLVTSSQPILSSVVVAKNKCREYLVLSEKIIAKTCAVQEFEEYSRRDYGRPARDKKSGMLPPKLAKIMINLSGAKTNEIILDPFCGSGTILQEALLLGYKNVIGSDVSKKAVEDTKKNLSWLKGKFQITNNKPQIFQSDVRSLDTLGMTNSIDAIVTEPYLGPPLRGAEKKEQIQKNINELENLYVAAFQEFKKVLSSDGRVVIIFPEFVFHKEIMKLDILKKLESLGFVTKQNFQYSRQGQKVIRRIYIFTAQKH